MTGNFAGAARAVQNQNQASSHAVKHPSAAVGQDLMDPATAVAQPSPQPFAAAVTAVPLDAAVASEPAQPSSMTENIADFVLLLLLGASYMMHTCVRARDFVVCDVACSTPSYATFCTS